MKPTEYGKKHIERLNLNRYHWKKPTGVDDLDAEVKMKPTGVKWE